MGQLDLDNMYFKNTCSHCLSDAINNFPIVELARITQTQKSVLEDIKNGFDGKVHPDLFNFYKDNYHKAITGVFGEVDINSKYFSKVQEFKLNTSRFAAYKASHCTESLKNSFALDPAKFAKGGEKILKQFTRWQAVEYNTTTARCRSAKQFMQFLEDKELYPNMEWLPSRAAEPEAVHQGYWGTILPIDDPFWQSNQPGDRWGCKCDWQNTDKEPTGQPKVTAVPIKGLDGNPASTGELFTDKHNYITKASKDIQTDLIELSYKDNKGNFPINVIADKIEIAENVATGRNLVDNIKDIDLKIREHIIKDGIKNQEYSINNMLADAKRLTKYEGITNGFKSAIEQKCKVVIIDFNKHFNTSKNFDQKVVYKKINRRIKDFENEVIKECYLVYGKKAVKITIDSFSELELNNLLKAIQPE